MMKMPIMFRKLAIMLYASLLSGFLGCSTERPADMIIRGGRIYTMNRTSPQVEAVAFRGDRIVYAGSAGGVDKLQGKDTRLLDLQGKTALPGLIDAHAHLISLGRSLAQLNLVGTTSPEQIRGMVLENLEKTPLGGWISGRGWDQNDWDVKQFPSWWDLMGTESHPVYLSRVDGHAVWVNKTALDLCGITADTPDPEGGRIIRDERGEPTGVFVDNAIDLIKNKMPEPSPEELTAWAGSAIRECNRVGLVGMHDAWVDSIRLEIYRELHRQGELTLRINALLSTEDEGFLGSWFERGPATEADHHLTVRSVKFFADGALGSRGAALLEPYSDEPSNQGLLLVKSERLYQTTKRALDNGFQVCTHAIGDAANRLVLDAYEKALQENPVEDHRLRIEHSQIVTLQDIPRFAKLGVIPSMQPTHATSDMPWVEDRLGPERIRGAYAWRKFLDQGCRIPCGSDFPVESPNPLWGIYSAVTRQDHQGWPEGGWCPEERMTLEEVVRGFTIDAAWAEFAENLKGSIEVGKLADFTVLDKDIFSITPAEILKTRVMYTIIGGKIVYEAPGAGENIVR